MKLIGLTRSLPYFKYHLLFQLEVFRINNDSVVPSDRLLQSNLTDEGLKHSCIFWVNLIGLKLSSNFGIDRSIKGTFTVVEEDWSRTTLAAGTTIWLISTAFQELLLGSIWKISMRNYLFPYSNLTNLTYEFTFDQSARCTKLPGRIIHWMPLDES